MRRSFGDLAPALVAAHEHHRFARVVVDRAAAIVLECLVGGAGVGIITGCPRGLPIARSVGNQLRLNSSAS
jgi:hypothetical protein